MVVQNSERQVTFTVFAKTLLTDAAKPTATDREAIILRLIDQRGPLRISDMVQYLDIGKLCRVLHVVASYHENVFAQQICVIKCSSNHRLKRPSTM